MFKRLIVPLVLILTAPVPAFAQDDVVELPAVTVSATRPVNASSDVYVPGENVELRPQGRPADFLRQAPGLIIAQHAGGGKSDQTFLRGFDNDHGTDIAMFVDGIPVNVRSHAHGQGYADLHFLIPETIGQMEVHKGPFRVEYGDFANSGSVNFAPLDAVEENFVQTGAGRFDTQRHLTMLSPVKTDRVKTLSAIEVFHTDGPIIHDEKYDRINTYNRLTFSATDELDLRLTGAYMHGTWHASGQIPSREVSAGRLSRFGAVDPSEGGDSQRLIVAAEADWQPTDSERFKTQWYLQNYALNLFSNFTFFLDDPVNGDGIEQLDERYIVGSDTVYSRTVYPWEKETVVSGGFQTRWDHGRVILATQAARTRLEETNDVDLFETSYSPYVKVDSELLPWLRFIGGARADFFHFDVTDRLGGPISGAEGDWTPSFKGNLILGPWVNSEFFLNGATGFHSNDARDVVLNPNEETLPRAESFEAGVRSYPTDRIETFASLWFLDLESEIVFVGDAGETEPSGRSRRYGTELGGLVRVTDWLTLSADVTVTKAYYPDTDEAVARAPKFTGRVDATVKTPWGLQSRVEMRHMGTRWLTEDRSWEARGNTVVDWISRYRPQRKSWNHIEVFLSLENILDADVREAQFLTESQLATEPGPVEDLHFSVGNPRTFLAGLTVYF